MIVRFSVVSLTRLNEKLAQLSMYRQVVKNMFSITSEYSPFHCLENFGSTFLETRIGQARSVTKTRSPKYTNESVNMTEARF
jgi:hypothetical protein